MRTYTTGDGLVPCILLPGKSNTALPARTGHCLCLHAPSAWTGNAILLLAHDPPAALTACCTTNCSGYRGLTAVHSSSSLIQSWRQKHTGSRPTLNYQAADIAEGLAFEHLPYAAIIDKGTIDGLLCKEAGMEEAQTALLNVWSILKSPGSFIWFTHGPPSLRMPLISQQKWSGVTVRVIMPAGTATAAAGAAAGAPVSAPAGAAAKTAGPVRLQVANMDPDAVYPDTATYVYICKKPYV